MESCSLRVSRLARTLISQIKAGRTLSVLDMLVELTTIINTPDVDKDDVVLYAISPHAVATSVLVVGCKYGTVSKEDFKLAYPTVCTLDMLIVRTRCAPINPYYHPNRWWDVVKTMI